MHEVTKDRHPTGLYNNQASVNHDEGGTDMKPVRKEGLNLREEGPRMARKRWLCTQQAFLATDERLAIRS